ncbi:MAG: YkgJ family cysteine cluster protein [Deltaproteobacteria bacterium]|nr:YkgJ family cysteine cluster protein [Deltaproteobacteria bacterium]
MTSFECKMCGTCCFGEGGILVGSDELSKIADFLGLTPESFLSMYCETRNRKTYIKTGHDGYCIFFDRKKSCLIHPVKPHPCSQWPYYPALLEDEENWEMAKDACPGLNTDASFQDFVRESKKIEEK